MPATNRLPSALQLRPASTRSRGWLYALCVGLPVLICIVSLAFALSMEGTKRLIADDAAITAAVGLVCVLLPAGLIGYALARMQRRHRLDLRDGMLEVTTTFYRRRFGLAELDLANARVVDLDERRELAPFLRTNGFSLPGFHSGWYRLRNRQRALVAIADGRRVLWLPTRLGYGLLLQPQQPQALLDHLRSLAPAAATR